MIDEERLELFEEFGLFEKVDSATAKMRKSVSNIDKKSSVVLIFEKGRQKPSKVEPSNIKKCGLDLKSFMI